MSSTHWPVVLVSTGGSSSPTAEGVRFRVDRWGYCGPTAKTRVRIDGTLEDGRAIKLTVFYIPNGYAVDFELEVDGEEIPCARTALYRDGGSQRFATPLGELWIPSRFKVRDQSGPYREGIFLGEQKVAT